MASATPIQKRTVDPFASYNSNTVNQLTEMITKGNNGLTDYNAIQVSTDSTAPLTQSIVSVGTIYKDDVMITLTAEHVVDFEDPQHYVSFGTGFNEVGTYYIVLDYTYAKSRPAPQASVKILKPSQIPHPSLGTSLFFLKAVAVSFSGSIFQIDSYADYDAAIPTNKRTYTPLYFGVETNLPTFVSSRDIGRVVYESETDKFWFGFSTGWTETSGGSGGSVIVPGITIDSNTWDGCIAYIDSSKIAQPAIASSIDTRADVGIVEVAGVDSGAIVGTLENVRVETGINILAGDVLYLSDSTAGYVTNVKPGEFIQDIGRALISGDDTNPIEMIFIPRAMLSTSLKGTIETTDWIAQAGKYKYDINITSLDSTGYAIVTSFFADSTGTMEQIQPDGVDLIPDGSGMYIIARIWMLTNTLDVLYNLSAGVGIAGGGSGGGGGGTTNHALLVPSSLVYAASGHSGFADDNHNNAAHSLNFITATSVSYFNMNANGDAGDAAGQLAIGDHTHLLADTHNYNDIPSGSTILFEADVAVVGYTLLTTVDDGIVYITKGTVAGGEEGGKPKTGGTWTQPIHLHTITSQAGHTHDTNDHTLTESEMPPHTHDVPDTLIQALESGGPVRYTSVPASPTNTTSTGGGNPHNHGATVLGGGHDHTGNSGNSATVNTWRPSGMNYTRQTRL